MKLTRVSMVILAGILAGGLAACSGSSGSSANTASSTGQTNPNATLTYGEPGGPANTLDPQKNSAQGYGEAWYDEAYQTLIDVDLSGNLHPGLATKWSFSANGLSMSMTLRSGVKFSDGTPFNGAAVAANIHRAQTVAGSTVAANLTDVKSVSVISPTEVVFQLTTPDATLPSTLAAQPGYMISPAAFNKATLNTMPDGTGPFVLSRYVVGEEADYSRNPHYWGAPAGVAHVDIILYADTTAGQNALASGQLDIFSAEDKQAEVAMKAAGDKIDTEPSFQFEWLELNWGGKFRNLKVRQALAYASDAAQLVQFAGIGQVTHQWVDSNSPYYNSSLNNLYAYDLTKAKQLLAEAGYPHGFSFTLWHTERPYTDQSAELMQAQWAKAGFNVTLRTTDGATILNDCFVQRICDSISGVVTLTTDFAAYANQMIPGGAIRNLSNVTLPGFSSLLPAALAPSADRTAKVEALQTAFSEAVPAVILRTVPVTTGVNPNVVDFSVDANGNPVWADIKVLK